MRRATVLSLTTSVAALILSGCTDAVLTEENFDAKAREIKKGMTAKEVETILGKCQLEQKHGAKSPNHVIKLWGANGATDRRKGSSFLIVEFENGVVQSKHSERHGSRVQKPPPPPPPPPPPHKQ